MKRLRITVATILASLAITSGICTTAQAQGADMTFFVTSAGKGNGADLGGLEGADAHCLALAKAAGSRHTDWRAYLSTTVPGGDEGVNARDRIGKGPWRNAKGVVIARNVEDLHSSNNKINKQTALTEKGEMVSGHNAEYRQMVEYLCQFLLGRTEPIVSRLHSEMEQAAETLHFERAAGLCDHIHAIENVVERQKVISSEYIDSDVIAMARANGEACLQVFFIRGGKLIGREYFIMEGAEETPDQSVLAEFLKQFYDETPTVPGQLLLPNEIAEANIIREWLRTRRGGEKVEIRVPRGGQQGKLGTNTGDQSNLYRRFDCGAAGIQNTLPGGEDSRLRAQACAAVMRRRHTLF